MVVGESVLGYFPTNPVLAPEKLSFFIYKCILQLLFRWLKIHSFALLLILFPQQPNQLG